MKSLRCPNRSCRLSGKVGAGSIIRFGFYTTKSGKRRRFRCRTCRKTFRSNTATPYHRLQHRRTTFDEVATLSVEGLNKSAIARVKRIAWNTVHRRLQTLPALVAVSTIERSMERLEDHLELIRCYYNFVRPHRALKFGREVRTPAMQAGLASRRLMFREIFSSTMSFLALQNITFVFFDSTMLVNVDDSRLSMAA